MLGHVNEQCMSCNMLCVEQHPTHQCAAHHYRFPQGPPDQVVEAGNFEHACEGEAVCKLSNEKVCLPAPAASVYATLHHAGYLFSL